MFSMTKIYLKNTEKVYIFPTKNIAKNKVADWIIIISI